MLKAGFAKIDVTPPLGSPMAGYFRERLADGILDPIQLVALAVNDGENTALIIAADFLGIWDKWATEIRELICKETCVPAEHIAICCLHQHTSVRIGYNPHLYDVVSPGDFHDNTYYEMLYRRFVDVAKMAISDMSEAVMRVGEKETAEPLAFIRRFRTKDGKVITNPSKEEMENVEGPAGEADNMVRVVRFQREGTKDIAVVNFSTHPDVIGKTKFTADWPGFVRRTTEADIPNTHCIFVNGAEGDSNHINRLTTPKMKQFGYAYSEHIGRVITDAVIDIWDKTIAKTASKVSGQIRMTYVPTNTLLMDEVDKYRRLRAEQMAGTYVAKSMEESADISRVSALHRQSLFQMVPLTVIGIGDVVFVGFGGEPFTQYGIDTRAAAPDKFVICTCITNGNSGYLPTKEAFEEGGYEARSSNFTDTLPDVLHQAIKEMFENIEEMK